MVGEHAQQDVGAHALWAPVVDGPHHEVDGLAAAEGTLDAAQSLVGAHRVSGSELALGQAGADDVEGIEGRLFGDPLCVAPPDKAVISDLQVKVLGDLVLADEVRFNVPSAPARGSDPSLARSSVALYLLTVPLRRAC